MVQTDQVAPPVDISRQQVAELEYQLETIQERESLLKQRLSATETRLSASMRQVEKLKEGVREQQSRVVRANENVARIKETSKERLATSSERIEKLKSSVQEQRLKVVQANERTAQLKDTLKERTQVYKDKLASSREKLILKSSFYDAARRYFGIYRQGFLFDEISKSEVDFGADAYLCLLPSTVPAGLSLRRLKGGRVFCDSVENVEVHKHSLAPRVHPPTLELINLAAFGSLMAADGILTVGHALAKTLTRFGPPVHVLPNYRWFEDSRPANQLREDCGLKPDDRLLFASGNVVVGFEPVIRALARLPEDVHLAAFVKLKPAEYEEKIHEEIRELGLADRIHFFDFVEYSRLASLASDADVGLITSDVSNPNGAVALPNRLFDYLTAGLPVIAPPMPDVVDLVQRHRFGITLKEVTTDQWVEAIIKVLEDRETFKRYALEAKRTLTWESGEEDLIEFLGNPQTVTLIGFRDISRYQRFLRITRTLTSRGVKVKAVFLSDDPAPVDISGAEFYYFSNRYGLGDGPVRVDHER
ncbi:glycosyltransferase [Brevibacterium sp.]|uniref:glycosyltransferase n=1 Tax=Brevibacterium sp. TaxID=1701 RepID=UPI002811A97A|nr:glycosyltransferase [Brevibacterium sp.]